MKITRFEDIQAWQLARELTRAIYAASARDPFAKDFGLRDQIRRAAGSLMHNIAEGFDAGSNPEFKRFLQYAQRSATEVLSQLYVALDQGYITESQFTELQAMANKAHAACGGFIKYLQSRIKT
ncbi:MAG TPA: four helix bundle protein [Opitutales bacterium]|jgi:four helix bundle protein|nr:four helix bundle protein [Opitutales bacterium]